MKKKTCFKLFSSLLCFSLTIDGFSLPKDHQVVSGKADFKHTSSKEMEIRPSDHAILNYSQFDIGKGEKVKFIQNSSSSCVLNRVNGKNPSEILGSLESNGKVFLVNPNGLYFGPDSHVNVGSFIGSTLDISDTDFLQENYQFTLGNPNGIIRIEGLLESVEGSIALMAPQIQNLGTISARAGTVALLSGEHVTLDFTGDGLMQFSVEGALKDALIEQLGDVTASLVQLKMPVAKKAISEIVNLDGIEEGDIFIEENGVIKFASISSIEAKKVLVEAANLEVKGSIDTRSLEDKGGEVHLFGRIITLEESLIDASGSLGGGEVLIGGEYQGKGETPWASKVIMNEGSRILSNATEKGDGGIVVLWSHDKTIFDGRIEALGGKFGGDGGVVETSSKDRLRITKGQVDALAPLGNIGTWLLDPGTVIIQESVASGVEKCSSSGGVYGSCSNQDAGDSNLCEIAVGSITSSGSTVTVQAYAYIEVNVDVNMEKDGAGLILKTCAPESGTTSDFQVSISASQITTRGGPVTIDMSASETSSTSPWIYLENALTIDTTKNSQTAGANISFSGEVVSLDKSWGLTLNAGTAGVITTNSDVSLYGPFTITNAASASLYGLTSSQTGIVIPSTVTTNFIGKTVNGALQAQFSCTSCDITVGPINNSTADTALRLTTTGQVTVNGNLGAGGSVPSKIYIETETANISSATAAGEIDFNSNVVLTGNATIISTNGPIKFEKSVNSSSSGAKNLTVNSGSGDIEINAIGNSAPLAGVSLSGSEINIPSSTSVWSASSIDVQGSITSSAGNLEVINSGVFNLKSGSNSSIGGYFKQTGSGNVTLGGNLSAGSISFASLITLSDTVSLDSLADLTLSTDVEGTTAGAQGLTLTSVLPLNIKDLGVVTALGPVNISTLSDSTIQNITTQNGVINVSGPSFTIGKSITIDSTNGGTSGGAITIDGDLNASTEGVETLRIDASGTSSGALITLKGSVGKSKALGTFTISGDPSSLNSQVTLGDSAQSDVSITTSGDITINPTITLTSSATITGSSVKILGNAIGSTAGAQSLTVNATGAITATQLGNDGSPLKNVFLTASSPSSIQNIITGGGEINLSAPSFSLSKGDNVITIDTTGGGVFEGAPVTIIGAIDAQTAGVETLGIEATGKNNVAGLITIEGPVGETNEFDAFIVQGISSIYSSRMYLGSSSLSSTSIKATSIDFSGLYGIDLASSLTFTSTGGSINLGNAEVNGVGSGGQSLTINSGSFGTDLGPSGLIVPLGSTQITASLFNSSGIRTKGSAINIAAPTIIRMNDSAFDTTNNAEVSNGANITFSSTVDSRSGTSHSLFLMAGNNGVITFPESIGGTTPLNSLTISTAENIEITDNVTVTSDIDISPPITLLGSLSTFTSNSNGNISLGAVDGAINSTQSLTVSTGTGIVELGVIGASKVLDEVKVPSALETAIHNITVSGSIEIDTPIILAASSTLSTIGNGSSGSTITFKAINGTSVGEENLTVTTGIGDVVFTDQLGYLVPPGNLDITGTTIQFEGNLIVSAGTHSYHAPATIAKDIVFRSLGDMTFDSTLEPVSEAPNLVLYPGGGALTFTDSVGDAPFGNILVYNAGSFSAQDITAKTLKVSGGLPVVSLYGDIVATGPLGVTFDTGPINFGAEIAATHIWARSYGSMSALNSAQAINISGDSPFEFEYFNAIGGNIGSSNSPINLNVLQQSNLGANYSADFTGDPYHPFFFSIPSNPPCLVTFNGTTILDCNFIPSLQQNFNAIPKDLWYVTWTYSSWDNFSNLEFFEQEAIDPAQNPRDLKLTYWVMTRRYQDTDTVPPENAFKKVEVISLEKPVSYEEILVDQVLPEVKEITVSESLVVKADTASLEQIDIAAKEIGLDMAKERVIETSEAAILHSAKNMEPIKLVIADKVFSGLSRVRAATEFKRLEIAAGFEIKDPTVLEKIEEIATVKSEKVVLEVIKDPFTSVVPRKEVADFGFFVELPNTPLSLDLLID